MSDSIQSAAAETVPVRLEPRFRKTRFNPSEAAAYLDECFGISLAVTTLSKYRCIGGGPQFHKFGHRILYPRDAIDAWAAEKLGEPVANTSASGR